MIVVDTNVISELSKEQPDPAVSAWFLAQEARSLATTSVTLAEVLYGLELLAEGKRRERLSELSHIIFETALGGRVLPFGEPAARQYARLLAARRGRGTPMAPLDAQIAAIALSVGASVATRNVTDFEHCGVTIINPWNE